MFVIEYDAKMTVGDLKGQISEKEGVHEDRQRLFYGGW